MAKRLFAGCDHETLYYDVAYFSLYMEKYLDIFQVALKTFEKCLNLMLNMLKT